MDIINAHPEFGNFPLMGTPDWQVSAVPRLRWFSPDNQNDRRGQNQTLRLITEEGGCNHRGLSIRRHADGGAVARKVWNYANVSSESVCRQSDRRGFKWFFRVTPIASDIAGICASF